MDEFCARLMAIADMKIEDEGGDLDTLRGMREMLSE